MSGWDGRLARWVEAGLLERGAADRIRAWEAAAGAERDGLSAGWPVRLALGLGGLLLSAGVLLFVAAHWDTLSPTARFALVLATVAGFHLGGAGSADRWPSLATTLHACGTVALGGGIFLSGQIFNLREHWPAGLLLWAAGAGLAWRLLRQWPQAMLAALVTPAWLAGEWSVASRGLAGETVLAAGLLGLAIAYLAARPAPTGSDGPVRRALVWIGGLGLIPTAVLVLGTSHVGWRAPLPPAGGLLLLGWLVALGVPLAVSWALRRAIPPFVVGLVAWAAAGTLLAREADVVAYGWSAGLAVGLIAWGVAEHRAERVNLGVAGFALTVLAFYFSSVMDRLGRSASLVGLGLLFLGGGWLLERARRRLVARATEPAR